MKMRDHEGEPFNGLVLQENGRYAYYRDGKRVDDGCDISGLIVVILSICVIYYFL